MRCLPSCAIIFLAIFYPNPPFEGIATRIESQCCYCRRWRVEVPWVLLRWISTYHFLHAYYRWQWSSSAATFCIISNCLPPFLHGAYNIIIAVLLVESRSILSQFYASSNMKRQADVWHDKCRLGQSIVFSPTRQMTRHQTWSLYICPLWVGLLV